MKGVGVNIFDISYFKFAIAFKMYNLAYDSLSILINFYPFNIYKFTF